MFPTASKALTKEGQMGWQSLNVSARCSLCDDVTIVFLGPARVSVEARNQTASRLGFRRSATASPLALTPTVTTPRHTGQTAVDSPRVHRRTLTQLVSPRNGKIAMKAGLRKTSTQAVEKKAQIPRKTVESPLPKARAWVVKEAKKRVPPLDLGSVAKKAVEAVRRTVEKDLVDGLDGYVAFDPADQRFVGGDTGGVRAAKDSLSWLLPKGLAALLSCGERDRSVELNLRPHGAVDSGKTDQHGIEPTSVADLNGLNPATLDRKRGGVLSLEATVRGQTVTQKVLALPKDYDGPIFVSDIDDTLRLTSTEALLKGETQAPIKGAAALMRGVAAKGVPIVYLSAGPQRIGTLNDAFLKQLPEGVVLARSQFDLPGLSPRNSDQAQSQGDYKAQRLDQLKATFPKAQIFGLGDDKYGDAVAYTAVQAKTYIHDVRAGDDNIPKHFNGVLTARYDRAFQKRVWADLDGAIRNSQAFSARP